MAKAKFPPTLVVKREEDRDGVYFAASKDVAEHAEVGKEVVVAVYKLLRVSKVCANPVME